MPKTRWPTSVATVCSTSCSDRLSVKQPAKRSISPTARSVAANSRAPASEVILPPSNAPTTERPSTRANSNSVALHSVGIGTPLDPETNRGANTIFSEMEPRCTCPYEKSGLAQLWDQNGRTEEAEKLLSSVY